MGKFQKDKGYRGENELRKLLLDYEIEVKRIPLSGGDKNFLGDLILKINGIQYIAEVKWRADGFKQTYQWLENRNFLFLKADRKKHLVVMNLERFIELIRKGN